MKKKSGTEQMSLAGTEEGEILARLQDRVEKAVSVIQELRRERDQLRERAEECERLRNERDEIRNRIESILANLEALEEA